MFRNRIIPCLLLKEKALVKTVCFSNEKYIGDPINAVRIFNDKEVDEIIILDINSDRPDFDFLSKLTNECFMPLTYGGGVKTLDDIKKLFHTGIEKVSINTSAFEKTDFIKEASRYFGSQSIIASIDIKDNRVFTNKGKRDTGLDPVEAALLMEKSGAGEILLNSIERDGTMRGYDLELIKKVSLAVNVPVIASGGAGKLEDLTLALKSGVLAVAAGSLFVFIGSHRAVLINYPNIEEIKKLLLTKEF